ncbi:MAG: hypothetical protein R2788_02910 [Saprospiraceae bacterium]
MPSKPICLVKSRSAPSMVSSHSCLYGISDKVSAIGAVTPRGCFRLDQNRDGSSIGNDNQPDWVASGTVSSIFSLVC